MASSESNDDNYVGFETILTQTLSKFISLEALPPGVKPPPPLPPPKGDSKTGRKRKLEPSPKAVTANIPVWSALEFDGDKEQPVKDKRFISCRYRDSIEIFIEEQHFKDRLPNKEGTHWEFYENDWSAAASTPGSLACTGYDDDGLKIGTSGARSWPANGFIAREPSDRSTDPKQAAKYHEQRYRYQAQIWFDIATKYMSAGSSRLWKPVSWPHKKPIKLFFFPVGAWPSRSALSKVVEDIKTEAKRKQALKTVRRLSLTQWLDWEAPIDESRTSEGLVKISSNLLNHYETFISRDDFETLVGEQTQGGADWRRPWPTPAQAEETQKAITDKANERYQPLLQALREVVTSPIYPSKGSEARVDASKIMGGQSANQIAFGWWDPKNGPKFIAEWLHRSAYSLGPLQAANYQSPENIVFGTFEANSDMTRAEFLVRSLRNKSGAKGNLTTRVVTADPSKDDDPRLMFLNPATGAEQPWTIPPWVKEKKHPWMAPGLLYNGNMKLPEYELPMVWSTRFHTFSRYSPIILEGNLDSELFDKYLKEHPGTSSSSPAKITKAGPSSKPAESSTDYTSLVAASPSLASLGPPARLSTSLAFSSRAHRPLVHAVTSTSISASALVTSSTSEVLWSRRPVEVKQSATVSSHPRTHAAWQAIRKNVDSVKLGDVQLKNPRLVANGDSPGELPVAPPATGFLVEGTIKLFGLGGDVKLQSWHGPTPPDIQLGSEPPVYQRVQLESIRPSELMPLLTETPFSNFEFRNVTITHQNYQFVKTLPIGWTITADIPIDEKHGAIYSILRDILQIPEEGLQLQALASLGLGHAWSSRLNVADFVVRGMLRIDPSMVGGRDVPGIRLHEDVILTRIGLLVYGIGTSTLGIESKRSMEYGFKIFGDMHIKVPGSITPLDFDFEIGEFGGFAELEAAVKGDVWKNAFGTGINLDMVQLSASFEWSKPLGSLDFDLRAHLTADSASALVFGKYSAGGNYTVSAYVQDLGCDGVVDLFRHYTGEELSLPTDVDITIGSATINIIKGKGLSITVDKLKVDDYTTENGATIELSSKGVLVEAKVKEIKLPGGLGVTLKSAYMKVSFEKEDSGRSTDVALGGEVVLDELGDLDVSAGVHLYKDASSKKLEWTVYGTFDKLGNSTTLGKLFPQVHTPFLADLALQNLMFIAASKDDPTLSSLNPNKYSIKKGVQFSACFDQVGPLNKLLRRDSFPGLLLSASWQGGASFLLDVVLPTSTMIHLGHGITTDPIKLSINLAELLLQISAGVAVPVPKSTTPLDFEASLTIQREDVKLEGEMKGVWKDPFGISESVAIGPILELGLGINLLTFPFTGIPTTFSFTGGLAVGKSEGQIAVEINTDPSQELLKGEIKKFGIQDLITFTRELTELDIPMPPDFIDFEDIELYMSTGVTLANVNYPAGFSFKAALKLFGAELKASAEVTGGTLKANGSIQNLSVGPLHIAGQTGKDATLSLQIGSAVQQLHVDGAIRFLDLYVGITLQLEILPKPTFSFDFTLHFTDLLTFIVDAKMTGQITKLEDLASSRFGFALHAVFEQHLVDYVREQVHKLLEAVKKQADVAIKSAEDKVQAEEQKLQNGIQSAQNQLTADYNTWQQYSQKVHADSQKFIDGYMKKLHDLQGDVETQRQAYNTKLKNAEGAVQQANAERAAKMRDAEAAVTKAKKDWDDGVANAEAVLESKKKIFQEKFESAQEKIDEAQRSVDSIQSEIDSVDSRIRYCEDASGWRLDLKAELGYQEGKKLVLEGYKATADGVLWTAKKIVGGTEYLGAKGAIPIAQGLVDKAGRTGDAGFKAAQATLQETDTATAGIINAAESTLKTVQTDGDALIRGAESALNTFVSSQKDLLYAAQHAVDDLIHSSEWLVYQTASAALDTAQHATHALDVAKEALKVAGKVTDGTITITEEVVSKTLGAFDITEIVLDADLEIFSKNDGDGRFDVAVAGKLVGNDFNLKLKLDIKDTVKFIKDTFDELLKKL